MTKKIIAAVLKPREERRLLRGHCWAYRNEFQTLPALEDGALVDIFSANRRFIGRGFYQAEGGIAVRILTRHQEAIDASLLLARVAQAQAFREKLFPGSMGFATRGTEIARNAGGAPAMSQDASSTLEMPKERVYRWVFGESDGLPGLVADRYGRVVVAETTCAFYARWQQAIAESLLAHVEVAGALISIGGDEQVFGDVPEVLECDLDGLRLEVPLKERQKTGLFLDQRLNRQALRPFARGARVFDGFCHHGLWALEAARAGAAEVLAVDSSVAAIEIGRENALRNGLEAQCRFEAADVETALRDEAALDLIVLDPPAFAKSRGHAARALRRYQALNQLAMERLKPGGILITCSCSHFVDAAAFLETLKRAASAEKRTVWLLEQRGAAPDHPVLLAMPETSYLKCFVLRVG